ncbi:MAG: hypothetical protein DRP16_01910 [Candidatus Aenigmatarchaeota archaeon]|nr:MAG: hypothetical protein DRP16_01910 [Candidatus Aenigmarchaeota archaeon]
MKGDEYKMDMNNKTEGVIAILAAFFVLFSAMLNPKISAGLAVVFLVVLTSYKLYQSKTKRGSKMEKDKLRKIAIAALSVIVTISVIAYLNTLPGPVFEKPYWVGIIALLFLYWIIFINWSKRKRK